MATTQQSLLWLTEAMGSADSFEATFEAALEGIAATLRTDRVSILLVDDEGVMRFRATRGLSAEYQRAGEGHSPWPRDEPNPAPMFVEHLLDEKSLVVNRDLFRREGIAALAFLPLVRSGRLLGMLVLYHREPHRFSTDEKQLATTIAGILAVAVGRQEAARTRGWLQAIIESSYDAIVTKTLEGVVTSWNAAAEQLFGYTSAEMIGRPITVLFPPDRLSEEADFLSRIRRGERVRHFETIRVRKDGRRIHISVTLSPIVDADGAIIGVSKIARDITDRKAFDEERERLRDTFIGILGHDLRNPLNAIAMSAALMLKSDNLPANFSKLAVRIAKSADSMTNIVRDVLDFAQGHLGGGIPISPAPCELVQLCRQVVDELEFANPTRTITVEATASVAGYWDGQRLAQAIANLVGNAIKHGGDPIRVAIDSRREEATIEVWNQGPPIEPEVMATIFEPFRSGDRRGGGLGLGLFIVREIVRAHGGRVAVSSTEEAGTAFTVHLPRYPAG